MKTVKQGEDIFVEFNNFNELKEIFMEAIKIIEDKSK